MSITEALQNVRQEIARAALGCGRDPRDICLLGASKMNAPDRIQEAIKAGLTVCGENRVQELLDKKAQGAYEGARLDFIGHLQKNKAKQVVGQVSLIHSVDSMELMALISRLALERGIQQHILLEVNVAGEASKSGFKPEEIASAVEGAAQFPGIFLRGLMAIPPICRIPEENTPYFRLMNKLFIDNGAKKYDNVDMGILSMGMSGDYQAAIENGANLIRLGSAIFGQRKYPAHQ